MSDRQKKTILIVVALLLIFGLVFWFLRSRDEEAAPSNPDAGVSEQTPGAGLSRSGELVVSESTTLGGAVSVPEPAPPAELAIRQLAMTFAERYGSFSSEGDFVNIEDLYPVMTERYQRASEAGVALARASTDSAAGFVAMSTSALSAEVTLPEGEASSSAVVVVTTQRTRLTSGEPSTTRVQQMTVDLLKTPDGWRVDGAQWIEL